MLRWKRFALVVAMCILAIRAVVVQIAFFLHIRTFVYGRLPVFPKPMISATGFMSFFSVVIALFKVFWICILLLEVAYGAAILVGASSRFLWSRYITSNTLGRAKSTDLESKPAITSFYMFIWQLFYAEYLLIPLVR